VIETQAAPAAPKATDNSEASQIVVSWEQSKKPEPEPEVPARAPSMFLTVMVIVNDWAVELCDDLDEVETAVAPSFKLDS
jgi:hypothetical protein